VAHADRIARLRTTLDERLLVTNLVNIEYLTGFASTNAALLVDPAAETRLYTDFRYLEDAAAVPGVEAELTKRALVRDLGERLDGRLGFEADALPFSQVEALRSGGLELVPTTGLVEALRAVKDEGEIEAVRRAARAADRAFEALTAETWIGRTERELAWRLRQLLHAHGVDHPSFDILVATGPNGSKPHAVPGDLLIDENTLVTVDWGARLGGYCSDCARTLATGRLPEELQRAYDVCLAAQLAAVEQIRPGMSGIEADRIARAVIEDAGFGEAFGHGLGHGVGIAIHEDPRLSPESENLLEVGNVITIEPGIYLEGLGGVRIEDLAVVREDGVEILTTFPKRLITAA
jgi:Xaa-Pro aminopeptidase